MWAPQLIRDVTKSGATISLREISRRWRMLRWGMYHVKAVSQIDIGADAVSLQNFHKRDPVHCFRRWLQIRAAVHYEISFYRMIQAWIILSWYAASFQDYLSKRKLWHFPVVNVSEWEYLTPWCRRSLSLTRKRDDSRMLQTMCLHYFHTEPVYFPNSPISCDIVLICTFPVGIPISRLYCSTYMFATVLMQIEKQYEQHDKSLWIFSNAIFTFVAYDVLWSQSLRGLILSIITISAMLG